jgi:LacI family transcriptional regulator
MDCTQVVPENMQSARLLTRHLLDLGHRRVAVVTGMTGLGSTVERYAGYEQAFHDLGLQVDPRLVVKGESSSQIAESVVKELFAEPDERPTALVVMNNAMTIGALQALRFLGLTIPGDVALTSYDDFEWADLFEPRLTTVAQDTEEMGAVAVASLLSRIAGDDRPSELVRVPTHFKHRGSCGCEVAATSTTI